MLEADLDIDKEELKMFVGKRIREIRIKKKIKQKELADKVGVRNNTISQYEHGINAPGQDILFKIANVLEVKVEDLLPPTPTNKSTNEFEQAMQMAKDFNLEDMHLLKQLIEKALSLDEKERDKFFDNIKFAIDYYEKTNKK